MGIRFSRLKTMILASLCCVTVVAPLLSSNIVTADDAPVNWSWTDATPTVHSTTTFKDIMPNLCPNYYSIKKVMQVSGMRSVCVTSNDTVQFGTYYSGDGSSFLAAVGFRYDAEMYKVNGICSEYNTCLFLSGSDTLVTKEYLVNGYVKSLVVYKNFLSRLKPVTKVGIQSTLEYNFDASNPDYVFKSSDGYAWPVGGVGASENGNWLAVEFQKRGIGLLNIKTLQMRRISTQSYFYDQGSDPYSELDVSNDGNHVVLAGLNVGLYIFDVDAVCGDDANDDAMHRISYMPHQCPQAKIDTNAFIYRFNFAVQPKFNVDGGELSFYAFPFEGESRYVVLRVAGYDGQRLDYLALGDSFTSGEGETDDSYYMAGTNDEYEKCHVSTRSYPFVLAQWSHINPAYMKSVACSGATTVDIVGSDFEYYGQGKRLGKDKMNLNYVNIALSRYSALGQFTPGRIHQDSFVGKYKPKVVTIGIGGNDAGFMDVLKSCVGLGTCNAAKTDYDKAVVGVNIKRQFTKLVDTYQQIHTSSPSTKIYAIGYPRIINPDGQCGFVFNRLLNDTEKKFIDEGIIYLNSVVSAAARAAGIGYIDVQDSYGEFALCGSSRPGVMEAINAIAYGDDNNMLNDSRWLRFIGNESFHPNSLGHSLVANSIMSSVGNIMDYDYCANGLAVCPDSTVVAPELSAYWKTDDDVKYPSQLVSEFIFNNSDSSKSIILDSQSLSPNSSVTIELHSDIVALGNFLAKDDGSLNVRIELPFDIEDGYHTIHIYGTSYSGEPIDLYQVIKHISPITDYSINNDILTELMSNKTESAEISEALVSSVYVGLDNGVVENNSGNHTLCSLESERAVNSAYSATDDVTDVAVKGVSTTPDVSKFSLLNNHSYISSDAALVIFILVFVIILIGIVIKMYL